MSAKSKKALWITIGVITVVGLGYIAWRQWGSGEPMFGPGKVDRDAKFSRMFNFRKAD